VLPGKQSEKQNTKKSMNALISAKINMMKMPHAKNKKVIPDMKALTYMTLERKNPYTELYGTNRPSSLSRSNMNIC
jgi:hypothetical protein